MDTEKLFWRIYLRLCQGADQWHNRRFPPSLEVRIGERTVEFSRRGWQMTCRRAETLQDGFGGPCNLLLSGPSVRAIASLELLRSSFLIGVNGSPAVLDRRGAGVDMYVVDDLAFLRNRTADFLRFAGRAAFTLVNYGIVAELMERGLTLPNAVIVDSINAPFRRPRPAPRREVVFSRTFAAGLKPYGTVAYIGLQAAYCLGFRHVKIFGLDLTAHGRSYAEKRPEPSNLLVDYEDLILRPFRHVGAMVAGREWTVLNCSPQSRLPGTVLPKIEPNLALLNSVRGQLAVG
jgi:hypothetical protein